MDASLTASCPRRENRTFAKSAICLGMLLGAPLYAEAAEPRPAPEGCLEPALERAGLARLSDPGARAARATFVPRLGIGLRSDERIGPGVTARALEVFAWVGFPLESRPTAGLGTLSVRRQQLAHEVADRARRLHRIQARPRAAGWRARLDDALDAEELRAQLAALGAEDCP